MAVLHVCRVMELAARDYARTNLAKAAEVSSPLLAEQISDWWTLSWWSKALQFDRYRISALSQLLLSQIAISTGLIFTADKRHLQAAWLSNFNHITLSGVSIVYQCIHRAFQYYQPLIMSSQRKKIIGPTASSITDTIQVTDDQSSKISEKATALTETRLKRSGSWRAPFIIISFFIAGLCLALVHHFFNSYLHGRAVSVAVISQTWVSRLGTGFAFLFKMVLAISIGSAYIQRQWWKFHRQDFSIHEIDAITSILGNISSISTLSAWARTPILLVIAVISW